MNFRQTVRVNKPIRILAAALACCAVVATSCGDDNSSKSTTTEKGSKSTAPSAKGASEAGAPAVPEECAAAAGSDAAKEIEQRGKPTAKVPPGTDPVDDVVGTGDAVIDGGSVKIQYVLAKADGTQVESSWEQGGAQTVPLTKVFPGFAKDMAGMKVGGRRTLVAPASDVFGAKLPTGVAATDNVVFVVDLESVSKDAGGADAKADDKALAEAKQRGEPKVEVPKPLPKELTVTDDVVGTGAVVCPGATVVAHYTGVDASSGEVFDSSWKKGDPATFPLDGVIKGWSQGLVGMKVGGRRTLVIPGELAYGKNDKDTKGKPTGDLVFVVDLVGVG